MPGSARFDIKEHLKYDPVLTTMFYLARCFILLSTLILLNSCSFIGQGSISTHKERAISENPLRIDRASKEPLPGLELVHTPEVDREIQHYTNRDRGQIVNGLNRRSQYFETIADIFADEGIPIELSNIALVESGFNPQARSPSGAVGIWQFMKGTAKSYGLKIGILKDERKDPTLSSWAAALHLKDLYRSFGDWKLALAAYNGGSATVGRAIARGKSRDFWVLSRKGYFRSQTARYVPRVMAAAIIERDLKQYNFAAENGSIVDLNSYGKKKALVKNQSRSGNRYS